jgi:DNA-binding NtrC family response regulator
MESEELIAGKAVLIVDDEQDILDTLEDLLPMCRVEKASDFQSAKSLLEDKPFDLAILDIMGVQGYDLLDICTEKNITAVMLTARALTPDDVKKSFTRGAAYYLPKEEMVNIASFLTDIVRAKEQGKNTWEGWYKRLASFCEKKFGPDWQTADKKFWDRFPFY